MLSPRKKAIGAGEIWFMPEKPCKHCGLIAIRRVNNGECRGCTDLRKKRRSEEKSVQQTYPDMIIDVETAISMGFKVYRTGRPCKRGHTGWRYLANRGCVDCMGEK